MNEVVHSIAGHTQVAQAWLQTSQALAIGSPLALEGGVVKRCMNRMRSWAVLAREVIHAEFPAFDVINSMRIFDVSTATEFDAMQWHSANKLPSTVEADLTRLGKEFASADSEYDPSYLMLVWEDFRPRAMYHRQQSGCNNLDAWRRAIQEVSGGRRPTANRHPCEELFKVLAPYACM